MKKLLSTLLFIAVATVLHGAELSDDLTIKNVTASTTMTMPDGASLTATSSAVRVATDGALLAPSASTFYSKNKPPLSSLPTELVTTTGAQTIAGDKTVSGTLNVTGNLKDSAGPDNYIFAHFLGGNQALVTSYGREDDPTTWNSFPSYTCSIPLVGNETVVRDPTILKNQGTYYVAFNSVQTGGDTGVSWAKSTDLVTFTRLPMITTTISGLETIWAPEWFVDDDGSIHLILLVKDAVNYRIYETHASSTNLETATWSTPVQITGSGTDGLWRDSYVVKTGGKYWLFSGGIDVAAGKFVQAYWSNSLTSGYDISNRFDMPWTGFNEAPCVIPLSTGGWRMYLDNYGTQYTVYADTTSTFSAFAPTFSACVWNSGRDVIRHGTVIIDNESRSRARTIAPSTAKLGNNNPFEGYNTFDRAGYVSGLWPDITLRHTFEVNAADGYGYPLVILRQSPTYGMIAFSATNLLAPTGKQTWNFSIRNDGAFALETGNNIYSAGSYAWRVFRDDDTSGGRMVIGPTLTDDSNYRLQVEGNQKITGTLTSANYAAVSFGTVTLSSGTATITNSNILPGTQLQLTPNYDGTTASISTPCQGATTTGSAAINANGSGDNSVRWSIWQK